MRRKKEDKKRSKAELDKLFDLTLKIAKFVDQSFISNSQLCEVLEMLCVKENRRLDILGEDRSVSIFAITQLMELIRCLPMKIFSEIDNRAHILEAMQAQLDELIIAEEKEENEEAANEVIDEEDVEEEEPCGVENVIKNA